MQRATTLRLTLALSACLLAATDSAAQTICDAGNLTATYTTDQTITVAGSAGQEVDLTIRGVGANGGGNIDEGRGGSGATVTATFRIPGGTVLQVYVGNGGSRGTGAGGGGGTGVVADGSTLLLIAGGGGGAADAFGGPTHGGPGLSTFSGPGGGNAGNAQGGAGGGGFGTGNDGANNTATVTGGRAATVSGKGNGGRGFDFVAGGSGFGGGGGGGMQGGGGGGGYQGGNGGSGGAGGTGGTGGTSYVETATYGGVLDAVNTFDGTSGGGTEDAGARGSVSFSCSQALPVELSSFTATLDATDVVLRWETASETNNAGFYVERMEAETWQTLGFVEGRGTMAEAQAYAYRAEELAPGRHVFRLRQVDYDGAFEYSPEVEVTVELAEAFHLSPAYPNPFNPQTTFTLAVQRAQRVEVAVYDGLGRRVVVLFDGVLEAGAAHVFRFDAGGLASGSYLVHVAGETFRDVRRTTLVR